MKKAKSRISLLSLALGFAVIMSSIAGIGTLNAASKPAKSSAIAKELAKGKVNLTIYLIGDAQTDQTMVYDQINKKLSKDINTTVTVKNIPWTDYLTKYQLIFSSGENFDLAIAGDFLNYASLANKNAFMKLSEKDIKTYAPKTWADLDKKKLKGSEVNGKIYMVPSNNSDVRGSVVTVRGDLMSKYKIPAIKNLNGYYNYLKIIAKKDKSITAFSNDPSNTSWIDETFYRYNGITSINNIQGCNANLFDKNPKVYNVFKTKAFLTYAKNMRILNQWGVFPSDLLSSKNLCSDMFKAGTCASDLGVYNTVYQNATDANKSHSSWKAKTYDITNYNTYLTDVSPSDGGMVLNPKSAHKARALILIDTLRENKQYQDLTLAGIKNVHYTLDKAGRYTNTARGTTNYPYNTDSPWGWVNYKYLRNSSSTPMAEISLKAKWQKYRKSSPLVSFKLNDTNIKTEEASVSNTVAKYLNIIVYGFSSNVQSEINQMNDELDRDGLNKVISTTQSQLNAYAKTFNK